MTDTYAVVNADGVVVNLVLWDGQSSWTPPAGCTVIIANWLNIGDTVPATEVANLIVKIKSMAEAQMGVTPEAPQSTVTADAIKRGSSLN